eukprot:3862719-Prymnesium_polylepis.1
MARLTYVRGCGNGRVGRRCADRHYVVKGCRIACTRGTGMRCAHAHVSCTEHTNGTRTHARGFEFAKNAKY